ncbi:aminotransferase [Collinsella sp. AGMB00827]|uniref:Aminotransferase n=1 Tax=Collinsella ureilytica TaxID=2869515 RepID=A0ABS7MK91_9ACTN|nr:aminotransferase [Collinsella urealyticum]MBY4797496.1 aminotransferase [Collinsella urealyticum]
MPTMYQTMSDEELTHALSELEALADKIRARKLSLDMARGKPSPEQVDLSRPMLSVLDADADLFDEGVDCSNYGCFEGIPSARRMGAHLLGCPADQVLALGSSSLLIEHDMLAMFWRKGSLGAMPWSEYAVANDGVRVKALCPSPGYDRHFAISADLGMENIVVPMGAEGPDMDEVEHLVASDASMKAIWCVPKYSNPVGITYSNDVVHRLATMKTAAPDFKILWDNAYCVHDLADAGDELANIFEVARSAGTEDRIVAFASTSKITFPGAGIAFIGASPAGIHEFAHYMQAGLISADKLNQLRHTRFLPDAEAMRAHMQRHAELLRPRFAAVERVLSEGLRGTNCARWTRPHGGYFVSLDGVPGSAKRIVELCATLGVRLTPAGATFPGGLDPQDTNIRIAPSYPTLEELHEALEVLVVAIKLVSAQIVLEERS